MDKNNTRSRKTARRARQPASKQTQSRLTSGEIVARLADAILVEHRFAHLGGKVFHYGGGVYRDEGDEFIKQRVQQLLIRWMMRDEWSSHRGNEVVEYIRISSPKLWDKSPLDTVNVENGILNVHTGELAPHSPEWLSTVQLPIAYEPVATCPNIEKFVSEVFPADANELAFQIPAYLMTPDNSLQKAVLALGVGGTGKSTYLNLLTDFLGAANISNDSLHQLENNRFAPANLLGKLANICADLPSRCIEGTSIFKQVTGGDELSAEFKNKQMFKFRPFARLIFSANNPPRSKDTSSAYFERWITIPFDQKFRGTDRQLPDIELRRILASELPGLLNRVLEAKQDFRGFAEPESVRRAGKESRECTDPFAMWLKANTVDKPDALTPAEQLREMYALFCNEKGIPPLTEKAFAAEFKDAKPLIEKKQRSYGGKSKVWCYVGLGMKTNKHDQQEVS